MAKLDRKKRKLVLRYTKMKKAIILAAGVGKRLGNLTNDIPKCLLEIDSRRCLIDFSLKALFESDIKEVTFVVGFAQDKLKKYILENWSKKIKANFIYNERYKEYNNIYSAYLAKEIWDDKTILLNSDIIFHSDILKNLKKEIALCQSYLVIDDTKKLVDEDMKVKVNTKEEIKKISKKLDNETSYGEYVGITYLRGHERIKFLQSLENNVKSKRFDIYYEDALADILSNSSVFSCSTNGLPWTEVDTPSDLKYAREIAEKLKKEILI